MLTPPFNLSNWIDANRDKLKPPVGNQELYAESDDFIIMVVGGPNSRTDYHINQGEEIFYQLEGTITVKVIDEGQPRDILIGPGDMFRLPGNVPHSPRRGPNTIGLVIERKRQTAEQDGFAWYCENCGNQLHAEYAHVTDIVSQLPPILARYRDNQDLHTCKKCGHKNQ